MSRTKHGESQFARHWSIAGVGSLFTITGRKNCALSLVGRKIN